MADLGQVFTNKIVAQYMASMFDLPKDARIMDPCVGDGAFLEALLQDGFMNVFGCEIDTNFYEKCRIKYNDVQIFNMDFLKWPGNDVFDGVIMNPPYIRQEKIDDLASYGITKKNLRKDPLYQDLPSTANMYMYFVVKAIDVLKDSGQLVVIFPSSWLDAKSGDKFQKCITERCGVNKQVYISGDAFDQEPLVDVIILKLIKGKYYTSPIEEHLCIENGNINTMIVEENRTLSVFHEPLSKIAYTRRGITTGCNKIFINPEIDGNGGTCLIPIISSPKEITGYNTKDATLDTLLSITEDDCPDDIRQYLETWEIKIRKDKQPKALYQKIINGDKWYKLGPTEGWEIIFSYFVRRDMKFIMNADRILARDNFYLINPKIDRWIVFALLNNYYTYYQLESRGKRYGAGLLKLQRYDLEELKFPAIEEISHNDKRRLALLGQKLSEQGDKKMISEITELISKYSSVSAQEITNEYSRLQKNRLGEK